MTTQMVYRVRLTRTANNEFVSKIFYRKDEYTDFDMYDTSIKAIASGQLIASVWPCNGALPHIMSCSLEFADDNKVSTVRLWACQDYEFTEEEWMTQQKTMEENQWQQFHT